MPLSDVLVYLVSDPASWSQSYRRWVRRRRSYQAWQGRRKNIIIPLWHIISIVSSKIDLDHRYYILCRRVTQAHSTHFYTFSQCICEGTYKVKKGDHLGSVQIHSGSFSQTAPFLDFYHSRWLNQDLANTPTKSNDHLVSLLRYK